MILKIIFLLTIYSSMAHCCSVRMKDKTDYNFKLANTVMLVNVVSNDKEQYFISKKPWPNIKFKIAKNCGGYLLSSGDMIFSSRRTLSELMDSKSINMTNGSFSDVGFLSDYVNDILDKEELPEGQPNHFLKYCTEDTNCISTVGRCGERFGINKNNLTKFENYLKKKKEYKCTESSSRKVSSCINNFCS